MSARYIWNEYTLEIVEGSNRGNDITSVQLPLAALGGNKNTYVIYATDYRIFYTEEGYFAYAPTGSSSSNYWGYLNVTKTDPIETKSASPWKYIITTGPDSNKYGTTLYIAGSHPYASWYLYRDTSDTIYAYLQYANNNDVTVKDNDEGGVDFTGPVLEFSKRWAQDASLKKTYNGNVSSANQNAYPQDGPDSTATYYYNYLGSDNIDPLSVTYSKQELESGESLEITVSPRSNTYGGTIYYQYSYSSNGGSSWIDLGNLTTDTSKTVTVPDEIERYQVRVRASDNMGFTSNDYVTGETLPVSQMRAYVGINGKARKVDKMYIGINGKARQVVKGYIGVNGKARKFL